MYINLEENYILIFIIIRVTGRSLPVGLPFNVNKQHWIRISSEFFIMSHSSQPCVKKYLVLF